MFTSNNLEAEKNKIRNSRSENKWHKETKKEEKGEATQGHEKVPKHTLTENDNESKDEKGHNAANTTLAYDRAFFYVLRHNPTGFILFIGRYLDPETF